MTRLFHISDLHFGLEDRAALGWFRECVRREQPDAVLITGDLTMRARSHEFAAACDWIEALDVPVTVEVGNHDLPYFNPFARFFWPYRRIRRIERLVERELDFADLAVVPLKTTARAQWRPLVAAACDVIRCSLPPWREPAAFVMLARDVIAIPDRPGVLRVQASFRNDARWAQPWPALVLTLSDADNRTLGMRRFEPKDYLGDMPASSLLAPGQASQLAFDIVEPAPNVVAFDFRFD